MRKNRFASWPFPPNVVRIDAPTKHACKLDALCSPRIPADLQIIPGPALSTCEMPNSSATVQRSLLVTDCRCLSSALTASDRVTRSTGTPSFPTSSRPHRRKPHRQRRSRLKHHCRATVRVDSRDPAVAANKTSQNSLVRSNNRMNSNT